MGLDMYLTRKIYVGANYKHNNVKGIIELTKGEENTPIKVKFDKVKYIEEEGAYWRKANSILKWFVDNIQNGEDDCREYYVDISQLKELIQLCKDDIKYFDSLEYKYSEEQEDFFSKEKFKYKIYQNVEEENLNLKTQEGFFFGSTDYDEYYYRDLQNTVKMLEELIAEDCSGVEYYYQSSW